jgi:xanthine dehydrogenase molybdenum-binding subunit
MPQYTVIGKRFPRVDAFDKVTGRAVFAGDISLPGMLFAKVLRSPYTHAKILRLDASRARALKGVSEVISADDLPGQKGDGYSAQDVPLLARDRVVFAGQPVAAVAALDSNIAEEAVALIEVEYEGLPAVFDVLEAMNPGAPVVHPKNNFGDGTGRGKEKAPWSDNVALHVEFSRGDASAAFEKADIVLENTFQTQRVHHGYLETRSSVAGVSSDGKVTVWTDNSSIFNAREVVASSMKLPLNYVKVAPVEVGGTFGGKGRQPISPLCALLSKKTGRPVKIVMTRAEDFTSNFPPPASRISLKIGATREGIIKAAAATLIFDCGAYLGPTPASVGATITGLSLYRIPNLKVRCCDVLTNKTPMGFYRAPSAPQAAFAVESQMDLLARALNIDPIELRLRNAVQEGDLMVNGAAFGRIGFKETLERMKQYLAQRGEPEGENRGRGVACGLWPGGVGSSAAEVNINADGTVMLAIGSTDVSGSRTSLAQIAAEEFGISFDDVTVVQGDTATSPYSDVSAGSRTVHQTGAAVCRACQDARDQLIRLAAREMKVRPQDLEYINGRVQVKNVPDKSVTLAGLGRASIDKPGEGPIIGRGGVGFPSRVPMFAVHAADVEVDKETGKTKILAYAAAQDVGFAINPTSVEGQIQGAVGQGIGWALNESYVLKDGVMQNANLLDYRMPTAADLPFIEPLIVEVSSGTGPFGVRGVGEPPMIPTLATMANAIHSAAGVRIKELPMTPETIFNALQDQETQ